MAEKKITRYTYEDRLKGKLREALRERLLGSRAVPTVTSKG